MFVFFKTQYYLINYSNLPQRMNFYWGYLTVKNLWVLLKGDCMDKLILNAYKYTQST